MNQDERDEMLYRIDERTKAIDAKVTNMNSRVSENENQINVLKSKMKRNSAALGGIGTGITAIVLWLADKITRVI